jgi:CheY-like chemotaxis protein
MNGSLLFNAVDPSALQVLVIDDDDIARESMIELLRGEGHGVAGLPSPIGATKRILSYKVDVVVIDVMMPSIRGDKLAALVRKNPRLKHVGVVLVTGASGEELADLAGDVNAAAVVEKRNIHSELASAVRSAGKNPDKTTSLKPA